MWQNIEECFQERESSVEQTQQKTVRLWLLGIYHTNDIWKEGDGENQNIKYIHNFG